MVKRKNEPPSDNITDGGISMGNYYIFILLFTIGISLYLLNRKQKIQKIMNYY